jgi:hypothetical protein
VRGQAGELRGHAGAHGGGGLAAGADGGAVAPHRLEQGAAADGRRLLGGGDEIVVGEAVRLQHAGQGGLARAARELHGDAAVAVHDHLGDRAHAGGGVGHAGDVLAHAEAVGAGGGQLGHAPFVEPVGDEDLRLWRAQRIEERARLAHERGRDVGVEAHAGERARGGGDGVADAAHGVVGVDEQRGVLGEGVREGRERGALGVVGGHARLLGGLDHEVIHGALRGHAPALRGAHVRRGGAAGDPRRVRGVDGLVGMGAPLAELEHRLAGGGEHDARGLGRDHRRVVDRRQPRRLDELGLEHAGLDLRERRVQGDARAEDRERRARLAQAGAGEGERAFGQGVDRAAEAVEVAQGLQELRPRRDGGTEERVAGQRGEVVGREVHLGGVLEHLAQAAEDDEVALARQLAEEERHRQLLIEPAGVGVRDEGRQLVGVDAEGVAHGVTGSSRSSRRCARRPGWCRSRAPGTPSG